MEPQLSFGLSRMADPGTSREAAESVDATRLERKVRRALLDCPSGATTYELAERMGLSLVTVSPRIRPLVNKGLVRDSGRKAKGASGRSQIVWEAVPPNDCDVCGKHPARFHAIVHGIETSYCHVCAGYDHE